MSILKIFKYILDKITGKRLSKQQFIKYIEKNYSYTLNETGTLEENTNKNLQNCIWQLWLQGIDNVPDIVNICLKTVKKYNPDKKIIILDLNTIKDYVDIPKYIYDKYTKGIITHAHFSDIVRVFILAKYGGFWIDSTVYLTDRIPNKIKEQEFFAFKSVSWFDDIYTADSFFLEIPTREMIEQLLTLLPYNDDKVPTISNWFLYSKPNSAIILFLKIFLLEYWKKENNPRNYFLFHLCVRFLIEHDSYCKRDWESMLSISNRDVHFLQSYYNKTFDKNTYNKIKQFSSIHKLTYKFDEIIKNSFLEHILNGDL